MIRTTTKTAIGKMVDYIGDNGYNEMVDYLDRCNSSPRVVKMVRMRWGILDDTLHTYEEVGQAFGVTRERIRQIESKEVEKCKRWIETWKNL